MPPLMFIVPDRPLLKAANPDKMVFRDQFRLRSHSALHIARTARPDRAKSSADGANAVPRRGKSAVVSGRIVPADFRLWLEDELFCFIKQALQRNGVSAMG
jgi:hypothetical protein